MDCFYRIQGKFVGHFFGIYNILQKYCQHSFCEPNDEVHKMSLKLS